MIEPRDRATRPPGVDATRQAGPASAPVRGVRHSSSGASRGGSLAVSVIAAALLFAAAASSQAAVLAEWNFNGPLTGTLLPVSGTGRLDPVGVGASLFASGEVGRGSSDPVVGNPPDQAWQVSGFPQQGTASASAGIQGSVDTRGHAAIRVTFDFRGTAGSARHQQFQYTLDGRSFLDWGAPIATTVVDPWAIGRSFDLAGVHGVADNPLFGFRLVSVFAPGTTAYQALSGSAAYATTGTWRFDMLSVTGEPIDTAAAVVPLPPSLALLAGGLLLLARAARTPGDRRRVPEPAL